MSSRDVNIVLCAVIILLLGLVTSHLPSVGYATKQCADGDGNNPFFRGSTNVEGFTAWDACVEGTNLVQEFYCGNDALQFTFYTCTGGCQDGACLPAPLEVQPSQVKGETFVFGNSVDHVEINEHLGDVQDALTGDDLDALKSGIVSTRQRSTLFNQYLRFGDGFTTGKIVFDKNEEGDVGDFLFFKSTDHLFEYEIEFESGLSSEVSGTTLPDMEGEDVLFLGVPYTFVAAEKNGDTVILKLVGGVESDALDEGSTKMYERAGKQYRVEVVGIDDLARKVIVKVNGEMSKPLREGDVFLGDGLRIAVGNLLIQNSAEGKDLAELYVGAKTLKLKDDTSDSLFSSGVDVNGNTLGEGGVKIQGSLADDEYLLHSITYRLQPDPLGGGDVYVAPGTGVRQYLRDPDGMLAFWDIVYGGLRDEGMHEMIFDPSGSSQYDLTFTNLQGKTYRAGIVFNNGGNLEISDKKDTLHFLEGANSSDYLVKDGQFLVFTHTNDRHGVTHIVRYTGIDATGKVLQFDDLAEGSKNAVYTGTEGNGARGDLVLSGRTYAVFVGGGPAYSLAADLDGDGDVDGGETSIVVRGGGILDLGSSENPGGAFSMTLTTQGSQFDENTTDEVITLSFAADGSTVDMTLPPQNSLSIETQGSTTLALSRYGVLLEKDNGNPDRVVIAYPLAQRFGEVNVVFDAQQGESVAEERGGGLCGDTVCDADEGYMTCPVDCALVEIKVETPSPVVVQAEVPAPVVEKIASQNKGFWASLWIWLRGLWSHNI